MQPRAERDDIAGRRNDFQAVNLVARRAVFDGFIAAGVVGDVAADLAAFGAGRIACVQQIMFPRFSLQIAGQYAGLAGSVHIVGVKFQNLVHAFQFDDDAVIDGNSAAGDAGAGRTGRQWNQILVRQLDDRRYFFRTAGKYDDFGLAEVNRISFFISLIRRQIVFIGFDEFIPYDVS